LLAELEVVGLREEVVRALLGLGRDRVQVPHVHALAAVALARAGAGGRRADVELHEARRAEMRELPAVDLEAVGEAAHLLVERRRQLVHDPARHYDAVALAFHVELRARESIRAERIGVQEGEVRGVEQVLDHQQVVGIDVQVAAAEAPAGIVQPMEVLDQRRVRLGGVAHPDPEPVIFFDNRVRADPR